MRADALAAKFILSWPSDDCNGKLDTVLLIFITRIRRAYHDNYKECTLTNSFSLEWFSFKEPTSKLSDSLLQLNFNFMFAGLLYSNLMCSFNF